MAVQGAFGLSDPGCVRRNNEDSFLVEPELGLYLVADGMGGAQAGEHASRLAVDAVREFFRSSANGGVDALVSAFEEANRKVMTEAEHDLSFEGMGTTLVAFLDRGGEGYIASVGDSRAYLYEQETLTPITEDQTWVNEVGRRLGIGEDNLRTHPMRHVLTMAIGVSSPLRVHSYQVRPERGCQILLSSDGLHGVVEPLEIRQILAPSESSLEEKCRQLVEAARAHGGPDNITAVLLQF